MYSRRKALAALLALVFTVAGLWLHQPAWSAATVDRAVCSTADKAGGDPLACSATELIDSTTQEVAKLYQGNILVVQSVGGTANAITGSTSPAATALVDGEMRQIKPASTNTSTVTYNDNSLGAKAVVSVAGSALSSGDLQSSSIYILRYYAANDEWRVLTPLGTGGGAPSTPSYVTLATNASLASERVLTAGTCVSLTDAGANSTATVAVASCSSSNLAGAVTDETGSGAAVFATSPSLTTPTIGSAGANFTGSTSGTTALKASATASGTITIPAATDTLVGKATTDTLTSKTLDLGSNTLTATSAQMRTALSDETGSGSAVFATSPSLTTPTLGVATATSVNNVTITAPATAATLTIPDGVTLTGPAASGTAMTLGNTETVTGVKTFGSAGAVGRLKIAGTTSGSTTLDASATASGTLTLPAATDTLVGKATTDTLTSKTLDLGSNTLTATSAQMRTALSDEVGTGALMFGIAAAMSDDITCTGGHFLRRNAGDTAWECAAISGGGDALTSGTLAQFSSTTSSQLAGVLSDETGSGASVFATSPTLTTPTLGVASATSVNKVTITAPATSATLTIPDGVTLTGPAASGTAMTLGNTETVTGVKTFGSAGAVGRLKVAGTTSGTTTLDASATASGTLTLPAATDTLVGKATTDTLTNKTINLTSNTLTATSAQVATAVSDETGSGALVFGTSPSFTTPALGTPSSGTLTNATGLPISTGVSGLGTGVATALATPSSANLRSAVTDEVGTGAAMYGLAPTMSDDLSCTASQVVRRNSGDTAFECATVSGTGDMVAANNLSDVASASTAFSNIKQAASETATGVVELATTSEATTGTDTSRAVTPAGVAAAIAASPGGMKLVGGFTGSNTTGATLSIGATYSKLIVQVHLINTNATGRSFSVAVSDDGTNYDTAAQFSSNVAQNTTHGGTFLIEGTGTAATNKTISPYVGILTGGTAFYTTGGSQTVETGITTNIKITASGTGGTFYAWVYGQP